MPLRSTGQYREDSGKVLGRSEQGMEMRGWNLWEVLAYNVHQEKGEEHRYGVENVDEKLVMVDVLVDRSALTKGEFHDSE